MSHVHPTREKAKGSPTCVSLYAFTFALGWGSIITRLQGTAERLKDMVRPPHPDHRNVKQLVRLAELFFVRNRKLVSDNQQRLCYD